jgi:hypothetical protein
LGQGSPIGDTCPLDLPINHSRLSTVYRFPTRTRRRGQAHSPPPFLFLQAVRGRQYRILIGLEVVTVSVIVSMAPKSLISTGFDRKTSRYPRTMAERWRPRRPSIASLGPLARIRPRRSGRWVPSGQSSDRSATRHPPSGHKWGLSQALSFKRTILANFTMCVDPPTH